MALRDLNGQEMLAVSRHWLDSDRDRPVIEGNPLVKAGLADLENAHQLLLTTQQRLGTLAQQARLLTEQMTETDALHDRKGRGVHAVLVGGAELADSQEEGAFYDDVLTALYPLGLNIVRMNYSQQAGTAMQVREQLTPQRRAFLASIDIGGRTLLDDTVTWLDAAEKVGQLFDERAKLTGADDDAVTRGDLHAARLDWIRAVNNFMTLLDIARVDDATRRRLLANLQETERRAMARRRRNAGGSSQPEVVLDDVLVDEPHAPATPEVVLDEADPA